VKTETAIREDGANAQSCVQEAKVETRTKWAVNPKSELHRFCEMLWICNRFGVSRLVLGACLFYWMGTRRGMEVVSFDTTTSNGGGKLPSDSLNL
jgi:hypothetical protein